MKVFPYYHRVMERNILLAVKVWQTHHLAGR